MFAIFQETPLRCTAVLLICGMFALLLGAYRCRKADIGMHKIMLATVLVPFMALFFSHFLYCLVDIESALYGHSIGYLFAFWEQGGMLYGGIIGAGLALWAVGGRGAGVLFEAYAPSGAWMIAAIRICEGLMGQGYGEYAMEETLFCRFPFMVFDPYYETWAWAVFLLEAAVALVLFLCVLFQKSDWPGDGALWMIGLYASVQIVLESLRRDEYLRWGFVRIEELFSAVAILAVLLCYARRTRGRHKRSKAHCFVVFACMTALCILLEFAVEGKITFLQFLDVGGCYAVMAAACLMMGVCVLWMRRLGDVKAIKEDE